MMPDLVAYDLFKEGDKLVQGGRALPFASLRRIRMIRRVLLQPECGGYSVEAKRSPSCHSLPENLSDGPGNAHLPAWPV